MPGGYAPDAKESLGDTLLDRGMQSGRRLSVMMMAQMNSIIFG